MKLLPVLASVLTALIVGVGLSLNAAAADPKGPARVYFGTYTGAKSRGIYLSTLDLATGALSAPVLAATNTNPSFLALHPGGRFLYAVNEVGTFGGQPGGSVSAFAIEPASGQLRLLNQQGTRGAGPCHLTIDPAGRNVLVANYGGGSVTVIGLEADGRLGAVGSFIQHRGSSVNPRRQEAPHAHGVYLDAAHRLAFVPDLGLDRIQMYRFDAEQHGLSAADPEPFVAVKAGAGPRHLAFHPNGRFAYVINELQSSITAFAYDAARGSLRELQTVATLPADFQGESTTAEIAVHPGGRFLYGSNRGHDSIAAFAVDETTGRLALLQHQPTQGRTPRSFAIAPGGAFLVAANQDSDDVVVFRIDPRTGRLSPTGTKVAVGAPVCVLFAPGS
jgi:6-phosphogluconolactonase